MDIAFSLLKEYSDNFFIIYDIFFENIVLISIAVILAILLLIVMKGLYENAFFLDMIWAVIVIFSIIFILYITVISRMGQVNIENPMKHLIYSGVYDNTHFKEMWGNILLFIPLGSGIKLLIKSKHPIVVTLFVGLIFSFCIEILQLFTRCGYFEVFDLLLNCAGMAIGCIASELICGHLGE